MLFVGLGSFRDPSCSYLLLLPISSQSLFSISRHTRYNRTPFLYRGPPTSALTPLSAPSPCFAPSNHISELFSSSPILLAFLYPPPLCFVNSLIASWMQFYLPLPPEYNTSTLRICIGFSRSDLDPNPTSRLARIRGSIPSQTRPMVPSLFPLVTCVRMGSPPPGELARAIFPPARNESRSSPRFL